MYFSVEDYQKIERWLKGRTVKDTEFPLVESLTPATQVAVVQNAKNKRVNIQEVIKYIDASGPTLNLSVYNADSSLATYEDLSNALQNCPDVFLNEARSQILIFKNNLGSWEYYQSIAPIPALVSNIDYWSPFSPQSSVTATLQDLSNALLEKFPELVIQGISFAVKGHTSDFLVEYTTNVVRNLIEFTVPNGTTLVRLITPSGDESFIGPSGTVQTHCNNSFKEPRTYTLQVTYNGIIYTKSVTATPAFPTVINGESRGIRECPQGGYVLTLPTKTKITVSTNGTLNAVKVNGLPMETIESHSGNNYTYVSTETFIPGNYLIELV